MSYASDALIDALETKNRQLTKENNALLRICDALESCRHTYCGNCEHWDRTCGSCSLDKMMGDAGIDVHRLGPTRAEANAIATALKRDNKRLRKRSRKLQDLMDDYCALISHMIVTMPEPRNAMGSELRTFAALEKRRRKLWKRETK